MTRLFAPFWMEKTVWMEWVISQFFSSFIIWCYVYTIPNKGSMAMQKYSHGIGCISSVLYPFWKIFSIQLYSRVQAGGNTSFATVNMWSSITWIARGRKLPFCWESMMNRRIWTGSRKTGGRRPNLKVRLRDPEWPKQSVRCINPERIQSEKYRCPERPNQTKDLGIQSAQTSR